MLAMRNRLFMMFILFIAIGCVFVGRTDKASAEASAIYPRNPTDATYYCRVTVGCGSPTANTPIYLTVGSGEFSNNISLTKVYSVGPSYTVNIVEATICGTAQNDGYQNVQSLDLVNTAFSMNVFFFNHNRSQIVQSTNIGSSCVNRNRSFNVTLPASSYNSATNRYEGYIRADMVNPSGATNENSFRYEFTGAEAGIGFDGTLGFSALTLSNRNIPTSWVHDVSSEFAPACTSPQTGNGLIQIYDVDRGIYQGVGNYPELVWVAYSRPRAASGPAGWNAFGFGTLVGGDGGIDSLPFTYDRDLEYRVEIRGLSRPNAFAAQISGVSLEDFPATYTCVPPNTAPTISFTLSCDVLGQVTFNNPSVSDTEGGQLTVSGSHNGQNFSGSRSGGGAIANMSPNPFTGIRDGVAKSVTLTVTDSGGLTGNASANYTCTIPAPVVTCVFVNPAQTLEVGDAYYPVVRVTNTNVAGAPTINASTNISINFAPVQSRNTPSSGPIAVGGSATYGAGTAPTVTYPSTPASGAIVTSAGNFTATGSASYVATAGGYSGTIPCSGSLGAGGNGGSGVFRPYFKVLGGDIITYGTTVRGYNQQGVTFDPITACATAIRCGAGVESALQVQGTIDGVPSRFKQATGGLGQKTLTYANTLGGAYATWGGGFGGGTPVVNYNIPAAPNFPGFVSIGANTESEYTYNSANLSGGTVSSGSRITIYRSGNVRITSNIVYAGSGGYASRDSIPHLRIIATGNIYIDPAVNQLDGEYIALGQVYTCHNGVWAVPIATNIHDSCDDSSLIVNGALVGDSIKLTRTVGTRRNAQTSDGSTGGCVAPTGLSRGYCNTANIAEIIQFTPELFVARPASSPVNETTTGKYNSITSLPPLF
jgi:hypothetical protein